jgi:hypothetical protein
VSDWWIFFKFKVIVNGFRRAHCVAYRDALQAHSLLYYVLEYIRQLNKIAHDVKITPEQLSVTADERLFMTPPLNDYLLGSIYH